MTQAEVAEVLGVDRSAIAKYETGGDMLGRNQDAYVELLSQRLHRKLKVEDLRAFVEREPARV